MDGAGQDLEQHEPSSADRLATPGRCLICLLISTILYSRQLTAAILNFLLQTCEGAFDSLCTDVKAMSQ